MTRTARPRRRVKSDGAQNLEKVPVENIELLKSGLGLDIFQQNSSSIQAVIELVASRSSSPYSSPQMLADYVARGFPDIPTKIIATIDAQIRHRQSLEDHVARSSETRQDRAQYGAWVIGIIGAAGSLVASYFGVANSVCMIVVIVTVGGPSAATVLARLLDRVPK